MTAVTTTRRVDINHITGFAVSITDKDGSFVVRADVDEVTLRAAIDAAPDAPDPAALEQVADALRQQARDSLTTLRTSVDTLKAITDKTNANIGPADTKAVARETRRVARQVLALTRLLIGALDSADTGTD